MINLLQVTNGKKSLTGLLLILAPMILAQLGLTADQSAAVVAEVVKDAGEVIGIVGVLHKAIKWLKTLLRARAAAKAAFLAATALKQSESVPEKTV